MNSKLKLLIVSISLSISSVTWAQTVVPFTWPASNTGPYTLAANMTSIVAFAPSAITSDETNLLSHKYHHHTRISAHQNAIYLAFSSNRTNEWDGGMQCGMVVSTNHGLNWSLPISIVPSQSVWTNSPVGSLPGSRYSYPRNFTLYNGTNYLVCAIDDVVGIGYEQGAALVARAVYPNGTVGSLFRITTNTYTPIDGKTAIDYDSTLGPPLLTDSKLFGCWGGSFAWDSTVASEWIGWLFSDPRGWTEPNTFSVDGSATNFYRIWREVTDSVVENEYFLWQQQSTNTGSSWSTPVITEVPNNPSEIAGIRLSTGQYALVGNPKIYLDQSMNRDPLYLAISAPNSTTITNVTAIVQGSTQQPIFPSTSKAGQAQYPSLCQNGNYIYVGYSIRKEDVGFSRVLIPGLVNNNNDYQGGNINIGTLYLR
jgi:hypothetical protein